MVSVNVFPDKFKTLVFMIFTLLPVIPFTVVLKLFTELVLLIELIIFAVLVASPSFEILAEITFPEVEKHLKFERLYCLNTRKD